MPVDILPIWEVHYSAGSLFSVQKLFAPSKRMRVKYKKKISDMNDREYNEYKKSQEDQINHILDKISKSGYESLTREEKELLFKAKR